MATTFVDRTADGNDTKNFAIRSLQKADIHVKVNGQSLDQGVHYNIENYTPTAGGNIVFTSGNVPASGNIHIFRDTDLDPAKATYQAGSSVKADDLNNNQKQALYALEELKNNTEVQVSTSSTEPLNPSNGDLWWNKEDGDLYVYYTDTDSSQWVAATLSSVTGDAGDTNIVGVTDGNKGDITVSGGGATWTVNAGVLDSSNLTPIIGLTAGSYTNANITVDSKGLVTAAQSGTASGLGTVQSVTATAPLNSTGGTAPNLTIAPATTSAAGSMSAADKTNLDANTTKLATLSIGTVNASSPSSGQVLKYDGTEWIPSTDNTGGSGGSTNLTNTANGTSLTVESSSGTNTSLPAATTSAWGVMTNVDKTNLDANTAKVTNANHTGDVTGSTVLTIAQNAVTTGKILDDAVTADKLADSINTEIAANTAKVTNANHTGEVTGSTALTIADNVVDEANLKVSNSPTNGYFLQAQSGNAGGLTWAAAPTTGGGGTTYTHPNHSGEVTSNGDGATVIADDVVDEANLKVSNSPTNGYVLTAQSGSAGGLTWAAPSAGGGTSNFVPSWTNSVTRTINTRLEDYVNAADFGCVGDGVVDETTNLQNALTYIVNNPGKELIINAGVYKVTQQLNAVLDSQLEELHIRGNGMVVIVWEPGDSTGMDCLHVDINSNAYASFEGNPAISNGAPRVSIKNIEFAYNGSTNGNGSAIHLAGANIAGVHTQQCQIEDCQFVPWDPTRLNFAFASGVTVTDLHEVAFHHCSFYADNNQDGNQLCSGIFFNGSSGNVAACHYFITDCTFLYGNAGIRVGTDTARPYVEGFYITNCGFVACENGIEYFAISTAYENANEPGLQITNSHFNTNTFLADGVNANYAIRCRGVADILIANNLFYSGSVDYLPTPSTPSYRGCIWINEGGRFIINGNNFVAQDGGYNATNYSNVAITIANQTLSTLASDRFGIIVNNTFRSFKGAAGAIWLHQLSAGEVVAYQELNIFKDCTNTIVDQNGNNTTSLVGVNGISSDYRIKKDITTQTESGIDKIKQLRPVSYEYKNNSDLNFNNKEDGVVREGFIAHEVSEVIPSGVRGEKDAAHTIQTLNVDAIVSVLTKALQEAVEKIEVLETKITAMEES